MMVKELIRKLQELGEEAQDLPVAHANVECNCLEPAEIIRVKTYKSKRYSYSTHSSKGRYTAGVPPFVLVTCHRRDTHSGE